MNALERRSAATKPAPTNGVFVFNGPSGDLDQQYMGNSVVPVQVGDNFWPVSDGTSPSSDNTWNSLSSTASNSPDGYLNNMNGLDQVFFGKPHALCTAHMLIEYKTCHRRSTT